MKPVTMIVVYLLIGIALLHLLRLIFQVEVLIGGVAIPMWLSIGGAIVPVALALAMRNEHRTTPAGA